jgi:hypothetical protein
MTSAVPLNPLRLDVEHGRRGLMKYDMTGVTKTDAPVSIMIGMHSFEWEHYTDNVADIAFPVIKAAERRALR